MNKLKNIGISALAGTLVTLSAAQAGGVAVTGSWELSFTNLNHKKVTGNRIGMNKNIAFGAGGDVSDGGAVTWATTIGGSDAMGLSSASMVINMGGIATLAYDSGTGGYGANAVDNIVPTAWEEIDYGFSTGLVDVGSVSKSKGVVNLTVKAPTAGTGFSISYVPRMGGGHVSDGATSGDTGKGSGVDVVIDFVDYSASHFGFRWGLAGQLEMPEVTCKDKFKNMPASDVASCSGPKDNPYAGTTYTKLQLGPLHMGVQATFKNPQNSGDEAIMNQRSVVYGGALVFGDTLSFSYGEAKEKYRYNNRNRGNVVLLSGDVDTKAEDNRSLGMESNEYVDVLWRGYSAAINMGPLAIKAATSRVDGVGENGSGEPKKHSEINLSLAF